MVLTVFPAVKEGTYRIYITYIGYTGVYSDPFSVAATSDVTIPALIIRKKTTDTNAVTVAASKPLIEVKADKTILNVEGTITIKAAVSDIFYTLKYTTTNDFAGQKTVSFANFESRQFKLNFTWRFGNKQVKAARQRATGNEEENKGAQQGGNGMGSL